MADRSSPKGASDVYTRRSALKAGLAVSLGTVGVGSHIATGSESSEGASTNADDRTTTSVACTPIKMTPALSVDGGRVQETAEVTVSPGTPVTLVPRPESYSDRWRWSDAETDVGRERTVTPTETQTYTAWIDHPCSVGSIEYTIHVEEGPPWPEDATDPNDDGVFEDLNGNGRIDFADVNTLFQNTERTDVQDNATDYDLTGDGTVDLQDVLALLEAV